MKIYEAVDSTSDELYFPIGIWLSLEEAVAAFDTEDAEEIPDESGHREDSLIVDIRERDVGFSGFGRSVKKIEWSGAYKEDSDEYVWSKVNTEGGK